MVNTTDMRRRGFTLIELSVVLVIIGLVVGGVLAGRELIFSSKIKKVGTDLDKYEAAVVTFREKFGGLPGNLANATDYWPSDGNCPNGTGSSDHTCNGTGSGMIGGNKNWFTENNAAQYEVYQVFQQLALAHLIAGSYINNVYAVHHPSFGVNDIDGAGICILYDSGMLATNFQGSTMTAGNHVFMMGQGPCMTYGGSGMGVIFTPYQALMIDRKYDDGLPNNGNIVSNQGYGGIGCSTAGAYYTANYGLGVSVWGGGYGCVLYKVASF